MTTIARKAASALMAALLCAGIALSAAPGIAGGTAYAYTLEGTMTDGATLTVSGAKDGKVDAIKMFDAVPTSDGKGATYTVASEWEKFFSTTYLNDYSGDDPYAYVQGLANDKTKIAAFAAKAVAWMAEHSFTGKTADVSGGTATLSGLDYGYYLVLPYAGSEPAEPYSDAMLLNVLTSSVAATVKAEWPTVDKTIVDNPEGGLGNLGVAVDDSWEGNHDMELDSLAPYAEPAGGANGTGANVGDTLTFKLESKVPDMDGYSSYTFKFVDTLSDGLTLLNSAGDPKVVVNIGDVKLDGDDYTATGQANEDGTTTLTIDLSTYLTKNKSTLEEGTAIEVFYQAKVNDKAAVEDPETNEVKVVYSNNPSNPQDGTDESTPDKTYTYTFGFDLKKVAEGDGSTLLSGAKFEIYRDGGDNAWSGGSDDTGLTFSGSESNWKLAETQDDVTVLTTGTDGLLSLDGLSEGTYWVLETEAPDGYNKLSAPIKVVISATYNEDGTLAGHVIDYGDQANGTSNDSQGTDTVHDGGHVITIENSKGTLLPETGGMGTVALTVVGVIVVAAGVALVIRRNRKADQR